MSIKVEDLRFSYGSQAVLKGVSFQAVPGEFLAVLGPNGAGKSTLFRCILGLLPRYEGGIYIDGRDARALSPRELAHRVAYIPQSHGQAFNYTVEDMVLMGTSHQVSALSAPKDRELEIAHGAMERLGIGKLSDKSFSKLSGGEQQLVLIARALAQQSRIFLMDEPTSSLDYGNQAAVLEQAHALTRDGYTVLLSTHNPQHALWYADKALALLHGKAEAFGPPAQVLNEESVKRLYGVDVVFSQSDQGQLIAPRRKGGV